MTLNESHKLKLALIDHDDSFTMNIVKWLEPFFEVDLIHHSLSDSIQFSKYDGIALSPGPKTPVDYPKTLALIQSLPTAYPTLGICLGLQIICFLEGATIQPYSPPVHGKSSLLDSKNLHFHNTHVGRYHSLCILPASEKFEVIATSEGLPMWFEHRSKKQMGFQFHPESFLSEKSYDFSKYVHDWITS